MAESVVASRSRRLWLIQRLEWARRSIELLKRKRHILQAERERLGKRLEGARINWAVAAREAGDRGLRAAALSGPSALALAASAVETADVEVPWLELVGTRYPGPPELVMPAFPAAYAAAVNAFVPLAVEAYRRAIVAAIEHAAAQAAFDVVEQQLAATRRRYRAIEGHRIPALEAELRLVVLRLDELEREQQVVYRWARDVPNRGQRAL
jgi:V/A-type H+/Na+-transporting ATPase subunit D